MGRFRMLPTYRIQRPHTRKASAKGLPMASRASGGTSERYSGESKSPRQQLTFKEVQVAIQEWQCLPNRDIANREATTEQIAKNYLRKTQHLELGLYVTHHHGARWKDDLGFTEQEQPLASARIKERTS